MSAETEKLRTKLNESWSAAEKARRDEDWQSLEMFARVLAHDAKMLRRELQATPEGVIRP